MQFIARAVMLSSWLFMAVAVAIEVVLSLMGAPEMMFDLVDLPPDLPAPPIWAVAIGSVLILLTIALLGVVYWGFHRVLQHARRNQYRTLALHLSRCGQALLGFWVGFMLVTRVLPFLLIWNVPAEARPEVDWFPLDLDVIFFVLAVALWAVAGSLRQAAEIDDENRHFL